MLQLQLRPVQAMGQLEGGRYGTQHTGFSTPTREHLYCGAGGRSTRLCVTSNRLHLHGGIFHAGFNRLESNYLTYLCKANTCL